MSTEEKKSPQDDVVRYYRSPRDLPFRMIAKMLGPFPHGGVIDPRYTQYDWWTVKTYSWMIHAIVAVLTLCTSYGLLVFAPWTGNSIISGVLAILPLDERVEALVQTLAYMGMILAIVFFGTMRSRAQPDLELPYGMLRWAITEELFFRAGCESWTFAQRFRSCVVFGLVHLLNLILPICLTLALILPGAVFMWVYLAEYRRTQSVEAAVRTGGLFHAQYNNVAIFWVLPLALVAHMVLSVIFG